MLMDLDVVCGWSLRETNIRIAGPDIARDTNIRIARRNRCAPFVSCSHMKARGVAHRETKRDESPQPFRLARRIDFSLGLHDVVVSDRP